MADNRYSYNGHTNLQPGDLFFGSQSTNFASGLASVISLPLLASC